MAVQGTGSFPGAYGNFSAKKKPQLGAPVTPVANTIGLMAPGAPKMPTLPNPGNPMAMGPLTPRVARRRTAKTAPITGIKKPRTR